jgi:predicted transcriptional regulator
LRGGSQRSAAPESEATDFEIAAVIEPKDRGAIAAYWTFRISEKDEGLTIYDARRTLDGMNRLRLPGGDLEYAVLAKLWELDTASARDIHGYVGEPAGLVYTTTAKVLDRLLDKGLVSRERKGKAFSYRAKIARNVVDQARARTDLSRFLGPAPHAAVATLVEAVESVDPKLLEELAKAVAARRRSQHGT